MALAPSNQGFYICISEVLWAYTAMPCKYQKQSNSCTKRAAQTVLMCSDKISPV